MKTTTTKLLQYLPIFVITLILSAYNNISNDEISDKFLNNEWNNTIEIIEISEESETIYAIDFESGHPYIIELFELYNLNESNLEINLGTLDNLEVIDNLEVLRNNNLEIGSIIELGGIDEEILFLNIVE